MPRRGLCGNGKTLEPSFARLRGTDMMLNNLRTRSQPAQIRNQ
jgi:hypothetical protein